MALETTNDTSTSNKTKESDFIGIVWRSDLTVKMSELLNDQPGVHLCILLCGNVFVRCCKFLIGDGEKNRLNKPPSLTNVGATCYLNSAFQGISACDVFVGEISDLCLANTCHLKQLLTFKELIDILNGRSQYQMEISKNPIFRSWNRTGQQDSYELLAFVINQVFNELRTFKEENGDIAKRDLHKWLEVKLPMRLIIQYEITCGCGAKLNSPLQSDLALHVTIPQQKGKHKLIQLIEDYFGQDPIESYSCDTGNCNGKGATRLARLRRPLPRTICIHLQRSHWDGYGMEKINNTVSFDIELRIKSDYCYDERSCNGLIDSDVKEDKIDNDKSFNEWKLSGKINDETVSTKNEVSGNQAREAGDQGYSHPSMKKDVKDEIYKLVSVIEHSGTTRRGHYVCYKFVGGDWFLTNDSSVKCVKEDEVLNCQAYILFYEQARN